MIYRVFPPCARLAHHVECLWYLRKQATPGLQPDRVLPDGCMELVFNFLTPFAQADEHGRFVRQPAALLVGQLSRFVLLQAATDVEVLAVRFKPAGAAAFFPFPIHEITDAYVPLDVLDRSWNSVHERLAAAGSLAERVRELETELLRRVSPARTPQRTAHALALLHATEAPRIAAIARALEISPRQLERLFHRDIGLAPKSYARLLRFRRVLAALDRGDPRWADLAAHAGYSDQAHLVREFRAFTGLTPRACLEGQTPFALALLS